PPPATPTRLSGRVVDPRGRPVAGATVELLGFRRGSRRRGEPPRERRQETDGLGGFSFVVEPGYYRVGATLPGFAPTRAQVVRLASGEDRDLGELALRASCSLRGRVLSADGLPLAGAEVVADGRAQEVRARTDAEGRFRLAGLGEGLFVVGASLRGWVSAVARDVPVTAGGGGEVELRLERAGSLGGTLRGPDGQPLSGGLVFAFAGERRLDMTRSDADGRYRLEDLPPGAVTLFARSEDYGLSARGDATVLAGSLAPLDLALDEGPRIEGVLRDRRGEPLAGLRVVARSRIGDAVRRSEPTGPDGRYRIERLYPGRYAVEVLRGRRRGPSAALARAEVEAPGGVALRDFVVPTPALLAGRLRDERGRPVVGVSVYAIAGQEVRGQARSDDRGRFRCEGLPAGAYSVFAREGEERVGKATVELREGERREDLEIVVRPPARLRGRVLLPDGAPAPGLTLRLRGGDAPVRRRARSDAEGRFELGPLYDGDYVFEADAGSLRLLARRAGLSGLTLPPSTVAVRAGRAPELELSLRASP
ncbi:MAG: carboxypeptidase regulatory-like domain-containing protein, partial [Planctomycetota bacterium]